jgi:hypothetical protein
MAGKGEEAIGNTTTEGEGRWQRSTCPIAPGDPRDEPAIDEVLLVLEAHGVAGNGTTSFKRWTEGGKYRRSAMSERTRSGAIKETIEPRSTRAAGRNRYRPRGRLEVRLQVRRAQITRHAAEPAVAVIVAAKSIRASLPLSDRELAHRS